MIDSIAMNTEQESPRMLRHPQAASSTEPTRFQWPWGMVSVLGLTVLAVIPFLR